jgi:hypothetical protein
MDTLGQYLAKHCVQFYPPGVPVTRNVPPQSVPQLFDEATDRTPDRAAVTSYRREITRRELRDESPSS